MSKLQPALALSKKYTADTMAGAGAIKGDKGDKGDTGAQGEKGEKGDTGADGKSAYEVAVANGYSGTETEWLASLKGADGADGKDGTNGTDGTNGVDGKDGVSPTITENSGNTDSIYKLDITDASGTFTTPNLKGADGSGSGGGEENVIEIVKVNGTALTPDADKAVDVTVPTKVSELTNDSKYQTDTDVSNTLGDYAKTEDIPTVPTAVSAFTNDAKYQTDTEVSTAIASAVASAYIYKGTVADSSALPTENLVVGWVYNLEDTGMNVAWNGTAWDNLGSTVDLSAYTTKTYVDNQLASKADTDDIPTVPSNVSAFTNDSGYQTADDVTEALGDYAKTEDVANGYVAKGTTVATNASSNGAVANMSVGAGTNSEYGYGQYCVSFSDTAAIMLKTNSDRDNFQLITTSDGSTYVGHGVLATTDDLSNYIAKSTSIGTTATNGAWTQLSNWTGTSGEFCALTFWLGSAQALRIQGNGKANKIVIYAYDGTTWSTVGSPCTTLVTDVGKTDITFSDSTNYSVANTSNCWYTVVNGICFYALHIKCVASAESTVTLATLPKPRLAFYAPITAWTSSVSDFISSQIQSSGSLLLWGGTANGVYLTSGSYPVAS